MIHTHLKKQLGVATLLLTVIFLLISMLLILFASQYSALQQKISSNLYRNQQAFEAAQAGLDAAIPYYQTNYSAIVAGASGGFLQPYTNSNTTNVALANGSTYSFVYTNPTASNYNLVTITSTGTNSDGTATRVLVQQIQVYTTSIVPPTETMTIQGSITLKNAASINNTQTNANIIAGGSVTFQNSAQTTISSGIGSNSSNIGSDVQQNNSAISGMTSENFFTSMFGGGTAAVQSGANYVYTNNEDTSYNFLNGVTGSVIWINQTGGTATIGNTTTIGSAANPVILIVNGNLRLSNAVTIYGLVFIMNSTSTDFQANSVTVNGAIGATGNFSFSNSATLNYNSSVLNRLPPISGVGTSNYVKVPGSWRDF